MNRLPYKYPFSQGRGLFTPLIVIILALPFPILSATPVVDDGVMNIRWNPPDDRSNLKGFLLEIDGVNLHVSMYLHGIGSKRVDVPYLKENEGTAIVKVMSVAKDNSLSGGIIKVIELRNGQ